MSSRLKTKNRRSQLTKPMGPQKEPFDELRLNKDTYKINNEQNVTHDKSKSAHGFIGTVIILMPSIY